MRWKIDKDRIAYRIIDGEAVILNLDSGYYYSLNSVGTQIWQAIDKGKSLDELLSSLKEEYEVPEKRLKNDLTELVKDLKKEEMIGEINS